MDWDGSQCRYTNRCHVPLLLCGVCSDRSEVAMPQRTSIPQRRGGSSQGGEGSKQRWQISRLDPSMSETAPQHMLGFFLLIFYK